MHLSLLLFDIFVNDLGYVLGKGVKVGNFCVSILFCVFEKAMFEPKRERGSVYLILFV